MCSQAVFGVRRRFFTIGRRKKAPHVGAGLLHLYNAWQFPTLAWGGPTLPSALRRFTSEFGMGSGGTTALKPPGKFFVLCPVSSVLMLRWPPSRCSVTYVSMLLHIARLPPCLSAESFGLYSAGHNCYPVTKLKIASLKKRLWRCKVKPHGSLVPVSSTHRCAYTPGLSTSSSSTSLQDPQGVRENSSRGKFRA